jgi:glycosyltransferase involved in cell wall biosynthesis
VIAHLLRDSSSLVTVSEEASSIEMMLQSCSVELLPDKNLTMFVPEVFYDANRARWLLRAVKSRAVRLRMFSYDYLPWLAPELINVPQAWPLMHYVAVLMAAEEVAFDSDQTRQEWITRMKRSADGAGPVFVLGYDGLGLEPQVFSPEKRDFVCIGSIEPRKNQDVVLSAFEELWREGLDVSLTIVGKPVSAGSETGRRLAAVEDRRFRWLRDAPDDALRQALRGARATIFVSSAEGFGLPPFEALGAGVPVIVTEQVPSTRERSPLGQVRLPDATVAGVADAVRLLTDDTAARRLWSEAAGVRLPTWRECSEAILEWAAR